MSDYQRGSQNIQDQQTAYAGFVKATTVTTVLVTAVLVIMAATLL